MTHHPSEHPSVKVVVFESGKENLVVPGANIYMLMSPHRLEAIIQFTIELATA
jgi:hypothetical protein